MIHNIRSTKENSTFNSSYFSFIDSSIQDVTQQLELKRFPEKGYGISIQFKNKHHSETKSQRGSIILNDKTVYGLVIGKHRDRFCHNCYQPITKKAIQRDDCKYQWYCCKNCIPHNMLDSNARAINLLQDPNNQFRQYSDCCILLIHLLFMVSNDTCNSSILIYMNQLFLLTYPQNSKTSINEKLASFLYDVIENFAPHLISGFGIRFGIQLQEVILDLLLIIIFNCQSVIIDSSLPSTYFFSVFPLFARLNHSCQPNCLILWNNVKPFNTTKSFKEVSLCLLRDLLPGEELCISYILPICLSIESRRELLSSSFSFICKCERCLGEEQESPSIDPTVRSLREWNQTCYPINDSNTAKFTSNQLKTILQNMEQAMQYSHNLLNSDISIIYEASISMLTLMNSAINISNGRNKNFMLFRLYIIISKCYERLQVENSFECFDYWLKAIVIGQQLLNEEVNEELVDLLPELVTRAFKMMTILQYDQSSKKYQYIIDFMKKYNIKYE